jgi:hypothetical protein
MALPWLVIYGKELQLVMFPDRKRLDEVGT